MNCVSLNKLHTLFSMYGWRGCQILGSFAGLDNLSVGRGNRTSRWQERRCWELITASQVNSVKNPCSRLVWVVFWLLVFLSLSITGFLSPLKLQQMGFSALFMLQRHDTRWGTQAQSRGKVCSRWQSEILLNMPARYLSTAWQTARTNRDGGKAG